jgi:ribosomal protein S18 acetylase RimI-like enzyme
MVAEPVRRQTSGQRRSSIRREEDAVQKITNRGAWLDWMEIGTLDASEIEEALDLTARGMRDNPLTVAIFGDGPEQRRQRFRRLIGGVARALGQGSNMLVARGADGEILGVCNMMPPGECLPSPSQQLRMLPSLLSNGPYISGRTMRWLAVWTKRDPAKRHWHLGPLVVDAPLQGMGVGGRLMQVFCAQMNAAREDAYLETDKPENVSFYERFGFEVIGEQKVFGVINYFMLRRPEGRHG